MAIVGLTPGATRKVELTSDPDKGTPQATQFIIGTLDSVTLTFIQDMITEFSADIAEAQSGDGKASIKSNYKQACLEACRFAIQDWVNFKDDKGNDIKCNRATRRLNGVEVQALTDESLRRLPIAVVNEIGSQIVRMNEVTDVESKNSDES